MISGGPIPRRSPRRNKVDPRCVSPARAAVTEAMAQYSPLRPRPGHRSIADEHERHITFTNSYSSMLSSSCSSNLAGNKCRPNRVLFCLRLNGYCLSV